jgi:uncharacterized protein YtpQ (UPF0354 family)
MDLSIGGRHLDLGNLYRMVCCDPSDGLSIVEDFLDRLSDGDAVSNTPLPLSLARTRIMPRIQPISIFDHLDQEQVAHLPYVNDTVIVYVIDMPRMTVSITVEQLLKWKISVDEIDQYARENLGRYSPDLKIQLVDSEEGGRAAIFSAHDGYDAARLLLDSLHSRLAPELKGDFYVAAPARDMFVAMSYEPGNFVNRLRSKVDRDFRRLPYPITTDLFVVTQDGVAGTMAA